MCKRESIQASRNPRIHFYGLESRTPMGSHWHRGGHLVSYERTIAPNGDPGIGLGLLLRRRVAHGASPETLVKHPGHRHVGEINQRTLPFGFELHASITRRRRVSA